MNIVSVKVCNIGGFIVPILCRTVHTVRVSFDKIHIVLELTLLRLLVICRYIDPVFIKMAVSWIVAACSLVEVYRRFRGYCCLHQLLRRVVY
jgi:hypothetical protein